jgi:hypothetical protein
VARLVRRVRASFVSSAGRLHPPVSSESSSFGHKGDVVPSRLTMHTTLRRSCDSCARSKLRCDLLLPQCSRCFKKSPANPICVYANVPLSSSLTDSLATVSTTPSSGSEGTVLQLSSSPELLVSNPGTQSFDPFDSYPQTRLPRAHVQRLIQHCTYLHCRFIRH